MIRQCSQTQTQNDTPSSLCYLHYFGPLLRLSHCSDFLIYFLYSSHTSLKFTPQTSPDNNTLILFVCKQTLGRKGHSGALVNSVSSDSESLYCSLMDPIPQLYAPCTARRLSLADAHIHTAKGNAGMKTKDKGCLSKQRAAIFSKANHRIQCPLLKREVKVTFCPHYSDGQRKDSVNHSWLSHERAQARVALNQGLIASW